MCSAQRLYACCIYTNPKCFCACSASKTHSHKVPCSNCESCYAVTWARSMGACPFSPPATTCTFWKWCPYLGLHQVGFAHRHSRNWRVFAHKPCWDWLTLASLSLTARLLILNSLFGNLTKPRTAECFNKSIECRPAAHNIRRLLVCALLCMSCVVRSCMSSHLQGLFVHLFWI